MSADDYSDHWDEEGGGSSQGALPEFLLDPVGVLRRRWLPMASCLVLGIAATVATVIAWQPSYLATASVLITSQQIPEDFVRSTVREDTLANINAMVGKVLSAESLSQLIDANGLFAGDTKTPRIDLVNRLRANIEMSPQTRGRNEDALVYDITYESRDPNEAATVANALASVFVESSLSRRNTQAKQTTVFLRRELERDEAKLREQSRLVSEFRREHRGELPDELDTSLRKMDMLAVRRESVTQQIAARENRITTLASTSITAPTETEIQLTELRRELARQTAINTDDHPNVVALRERIARVEQENSKVGAVSGTARMIEAERRDIQALREQLARGEAEMAEVNERIDKTPRVAEELAALEQKETVLREDYLGALRKVEEAELAESLESAQQGGQVSILDSASRPSSPLLPRWIVALGGLAISVLLAVGAAVLLELVDPVVIGAGYVRKVSDVPVLGSVPYVH